MNNSPLPQPSRRTLPLVPSQQETFGEVEDWDAVPAHPTYDPLKKVYQDPHLMYCPLGKLNKSSRKIFRQVRREMCQKVDQNKTS